SAVIPTRAPNRTSPPASSKQNSPLGRGSFSGSGKCAALIASSSKSKAEKNRGDCQRSRPGASDISSVPGTRLPFDRCSVETTDPDSAAEAHAPARQRHRTTGRRYLVPRLCLGTQGVAGSACLPAGRLGSKG